MARQYRQKRARRRAFRRGAPPGAPPGTLTPAANASPTSIRVMAYGPEAFEERSVVSAGDLSGWRGRAHVLWVDVAGLADVAAVRTIGELFGIHPLALEDVLHTHQRPKVDDYDGHRFIVLRMAPLPGEDDTDQLSMFLAPGVLVTFQERPGDCLDPVRAAIRSGRDRIRTGDADYLAYAIIDAAIDAYFPVLETLGEELDGLEDAVMFAPRRASLARVYDIKRRLLMFRRAVWPLRDAVGRLLRESEAAIGVETRIFLRDCYDHTVQIMDFIETYREICANLMDVYLSSVSNRLNEIMKVLTIITTVFIPLSFIAGIYGMNFNTEKSPYNMPELNWAWGYPAVMSLMALIAAGQLLLFWRRGWFSGGGGESGADRDS
ncbi:MAG: magnesium/cobalt transporter CorA [Candidatus Sumerlaeaceae bacterium]|nr:magnesium/cobalt transporter CorA [Candidatus Sumerlaeaceae bacterium]